MYLLNFLFILVVAFAGLTYALDKQRDCKCRLNVGSRIVGGRKAANNKYPWFVSMSTSGFFNNPEGLSDFFKERDHSCGASILNERWLLTAAHCLKNRKLTDISIGFGDNDLKILFDNGKIGLKQMIPYPTFDQHGVLSDDIALLELKTPLNFTDKIYPACLGINYRSEPENELVSIGHGIWDAHIRDYNTGKSKGGNLSRYLRETEVQDVSSLECKKNPNGICVKAFKKGDSTCQGDSGSPVQWTKNGKTFVLGVLSYGPVTEIEKGVWDYCSGEGTYARVSPYFNFIKHYAGETCTDADF